MPIDFKLPASSYDEIVKMIKAYNHVTKATLDELSKVSGVPNANISRNSVFFLSTGIIIENNKERSISEKGKKLAKALEYNIEEDIEINWKEIIEDNEFLKKMITALKIRNGMDEETFKTHIAYSSGQKSSSYVKLGSLTVITIFKAAKLIIEKDSKLFVINKEDYKTNTIDEKLDIKLDKENTYKKSIENIKINDRLHINININIQKSDFPEIIDDIKKLISELVNR